MPIPSAAILRPDPATWDRRRDLNDAIEAFVGTAPAGARAEYETAAKHLAAWGLSFALIAESMTVEARRKAECATEGRPERSAGFLAQLLAEQVADHFNMTPEGARVLFAAVTA